MKYWFTSDLHLGHVNIIEYCKRPFKDLAEMECKLVQNWNSRVKDEDVVFHIGDFCFKGLLAKDFAAKLNGNIIFIRGNHDRNNGINTPIERMYIRYGGRRMCLVHNPIDADLDVGLNLVGHVHEKWKFKRSFYREQAICPDSWYDMCNVGVDVWGYMPRNIQEILAAYGTWAKTETPKGL